MPSSTTLTEPFYCNKLTGFVDPAHPRLVCQLNKSLRSEASAANVVPLLRLLLGLPGYVEAMPDTSLFI
jgi:hypothetical protein